MKTRLVIFDLDGTLLNTIGDLAVSTNHMLALRGLKQHSYEEYCHFVGNGILRLVERALPENLRTYSRIREGGAAGFPRPLHRPHRHPYPPITKAFRR